MAAFSQRPGDDEGSVSDGTVSTTVIVNSGSVFVPSRWLI
jgi:hypothetical protein